MNLMVRPSKSFLYDLLQAELFKLQGEVGLDAASANFKNRRMFKTNRYYGLDIRLDLLQIGLQKYQDENTFGIHADLVSLHKIPENSVDALVSTNTLHQIPFEKRKAAIEELCRICSPTGTFICELTLDASFDGTMSIINEKFSNITVQYYSNPISRFYEGMFEKEGYLGTHPIAGTRPFRALAWLISRLEFLTCKIRGINRHAFVIAGKKRGSPSAQKFNLSSLPIIEERIFEMMKHDS
ncbi:MAG: methyltransferase domain-containing protein [bacterium]|nr:methyltransferase domain-containing protein [bacterium]